MLIVLYGKGTVELKMLCMEQYVRMCDVGGGWYHGGVPARKVKSPEVGFEHPYVHYKM